MRESYGGRSVRTLRWESLPNNGNRKSTDYQNPLHFLWERAASAVQSSDFEMLQMSTLGKGELPRAWKPNA